MMYVISDIHGHFDSFMELLKRIQFSDNDELYILGDVIDRGPNPIITLNYALSKPNIHLIRGNHEQMMLDSFAFFEDELCPTNMMKNWISNGGYTTFTQFSELLLQEKIELLTKISKLPYYIIKNNNILIHAGISCNENNIDFITDKFTIMNFMDKLDTDDLLWDRDMVHTNFQIKGYHIYCGHNPIPHIFKNIDGIYKTKGYTLIDCGVYFYNGKLACYCIDTDEVIYE